MSIEATDRYEALGMERPDPSTVCAGQCEGTGAVPVYMNAGGPAPGKITLGDEDDPVLIAAWKKAEDEAPAEDGWHFVTCPTCNGTGLRPAQPNQEVSE